MPFQVEQGFTRAVVGVAENRRSLAKWRVIAHRQHVGTELVDTDAFRFGHGLAASATVFSKTGIEKLQHRNVQAIEPNHGLIIWSHAVVVM